MTYRLYLGSNTPDYSPPTFKGGWTRTANAATRAVTSDKTGIGGNGFRSTLTTASSNVDGYSECLYRGVSNPLAAGTLAAGTLDLGIQVSEPAATTNAVIKVHAYITQGSTDLVRATLLNQYVDSVELSTGTLPGQSLAAPQTTSSVALTDGDRVVVEIGVQFVAPTATGTAAMAYGGSTTGADVTPGDGANGSVPWVDIPDAPTMARVSQLVAEAAIQTPSAARVSQLAAEAVVVGPSSVRVSQLVAEVVYSSVGAPPPTTRSRSRAFVVG